MTELKCSFNRYSLKKALAFFLAFCLCFPSVAIPAKAADTPTTIVDASPEDGQSGQNGVQSGQNGVQSGQDGVQTPQEATGISLSKTTLALKAGKSATLEATVTPENAADKTVTWKSSNTKVAIVSNGTVTAKGNGSANITATTKNGLSAACKVTVTTDVTKVTLSPASMTIAVKYSASLKAAVYPNTASNKKLTWKSSNTSVATVSNGKVTGKKVGTATITATAHNGVKATCKVTVKKPAVTLQKSSLNVAVGKKETIKIKSKLPSNDSVKSFKSSNSKIATVSSKGVVTGKKLGKATITVTMKSGAKATCKVTVKKPSVSLQKTSATVQVGKKTTIQIKSKLPSNDSVKSFKSSNSKIAAVSSKGVVTGKKAGTATITVTMKSGATAAFKVTVKKAAAKKPSVTLKKTAATIKVKKTTTIQIKSKYPAKDTVKSYKSSNAKVAAVSKKGVVTGKKAGTATITVTMKSGAKATFKVTVKK